MRRREFCAGLGSAVLVAAGRGTFAEQKQAAPRDVDPDPIGGYTVRPPKRFLFTDLRHIDPCDISWRSPDGKPLPVAGPPAPPVPATADTGLVPRGIRLVVQPARKEGPIDNLPFRVLLDGGTYRSWSLTANYPPGKNLGSYSSVPPKSLTVRYGESKDGYAWGWRDACEIPVSGITGVDGEHFFVDPHGPADERYKCIYNAWVLENPGALWERYRKIHPRHRDIRLRPDYIYCLFGLVSPDGLNWKPIAEPLIIHKGDTDNTVYYDEWLGKYVLYTRLYWLQRRMIARAESDDFRHWTPVDPVVWPGLDDPFSYDVYTNGRTSYPGLPEHHLMFPMFYRRYTQTSEVRLLTSLDGIRWDRVPGEAVIEPGNPGDWDGEYIAAGKDLVPLGKDRIAIPFGGCSHPHKYPRWPGVISSKTGWAWWPKGRLSGLVADEEGQFCTFGISVTGRELKVNAKVRRAGELRVGVLGVDGRSVGECDPITGNEMARAVTWKGDARLRVEPGSTVRFQVRMRAAELFGFEYV
jgi:hypothetical protein